MKPSKPLQRRTPLRSASRLTRTWMRRKPKPNKYNQRERDYDYLSFIARQRYCVMAIALGTFHRGPYEGDHAAKKTKAFRKGPDTEMLPLCRPCHRARPGRSGLWARMSRDEYTEFVDFWTGELQAAYQASLGRL